jgi:hypothetical protein
MPSASREESKLEVRGFWPILWAVAGMLVWAVHFGVVYAATAVACARGHSGRDLLGLPLVPAMVLGATALALAAIGSIAWRARRRLDGDLSGEDGEDDPRFTLWLTYAIALVSALAIVWEAVPVLIVNPCAPR